MRTVVEEYYPESDREETEDGGLIVQARMPEDSWVYGYILSFGPLVEVVDPPRVRRIIRDSAENIRSLYD